MATIDRFIQSAIEESEFAGMEPDVARAAAADVAALRAQRDDLLAALEPFSKVKTSADFYLINVTLSMSDFVRAAEAYQKASLSKL